MNDNHTRISVIKKNRRGFSMLEVQIAFTLLGIALAGICPLIVMQLKMSRKIQQGFNPQTAYFHPGDTFYLVPPSDPWERKLGIAAAVKSSAPDSSGSGDSGLPPAYIVTVVSAPVRSIATDGVALTVRLQSSTTPPSP